MKVFFYNEDNKENILLNYETSSYNNIPRIGEKVVIKKKQMVSYRRYSKYIYETSRLYICNCRCLS